MTKTMRNQCRGVFARIRVLGSTDVGGVEVEVDDVMEGGGCLWEEDEEENSEGLGGGFWCMQWTVGVRRSGRIAGGKGPKGKAQLAS